MLFCGASVELLHPLRASLTAASASGPSHSALNVLASVAHVSSSSDQSGSYPSDEGPLLIHLLCPAFTCCCFS
jgi:hypothetical protein